MLDISDIFLGLPVDAGTEPMYEEKIRVPHLGSLWLYCVGNVRDLIWQCNLITDLGGATIV